MWKWWSIRPEAALEVVESRNLRPPPLFKEGFLVLHEWLLSHHKVRLFLSWTCFNLSSARWRRIFTSVFSLTFKLNQTSPNWRHLPALLMNTSLSDHQWFKLRLHHPVNQQHGGEVERFSDWTCRKYSAEPEVLKPSALLAAPNHSCPSLWQHLCIRRRERHEISSVKSAAFLQLLRSISAGDSSGRPDLTAMRV